MEEVKQEVTREEYEELILKIQAMNILIQQFKDTIEGSIWETNILSDAISTDKIQNDAITTSKIEAGSITADLIEAGAITAAKIAVGTITADQIKDGTISADKILTGTITALQIATGTITATQIAAGTITATQIAVGTITSVEIAAVTINAGNIVAGTITSSEIATGTIVAGNIATNTITAGNIAANTITSSQIAADTITGSEIIGDTLSGIFANLGTITAGEISGTRFNIGEGASEDIYFKDSAIRMYDAHSGNYKRIYYKYSTLSFARLSYYTTDDVSVFTLMADGTAHGTGIGQFSGDYGYVRTTSTHLDLIADVKSLKVYNTGQIQLPALSSDPTSNLVLGQLAVVSGVLRRYNGSVWVNV